MNGIALDRSEALVFPRSAATVARPSDRARGQSAIGADGRIKGRRLAGFSLLSMPLAAVEVPLSTYLPPLYAAMFGFDLATIGLIFLLARLWDAVIDPGIGILSDRTRTRWGRRRPWIAAGGVIFLIGLVPTFLPPSWFGPAALAASLFVLYLGYSMIATPAAAWGGELSTQYHERTRIATYSHVIIAVALLLALVVPSLTAKRFLNHPEWQLAAMGAMVAVLWLPAMIGGLFSVPEPEVGPRPTQKVDFLRTVGSAFGDPYLRRVLASNFAVRFAQGTRTALFVFVVSVFMGLPQYAPHLFLFQYIFGIMAGPLWLAIGRRIGKTRAAVAGEVAQVLINLGLLFLTPGNIALLLGLTLAQGLSQGSGNLMLRAIVADVADHHKLAKGEDRTGLFFSVFSLSDKAGLAAAIGITLPMVAWLGFDPNTTNSPAALQGLIAVFAIGPAIGHAISAALIAGFPIDEAKHDEIRRQLAANAVAHPATTN